MISVRSDTSVPEERRNAYRCQVSDARRRGQLKINGADIPVEVVDESAGGFAVVVGGSVSCEVGQLLLLEVAGDWIEVRLANISALSEPLRPSSEDSAVEAQTRLGLQRVREIEIADLSAVKKRILSWENIKRVLRPLAALGRPLAGSAIAVLVSLLIGVMVVWTLEHNAPLGQEEKEREHIRFARPESGAQSGPGEFVLREKVIPLKKAAKSQAERAAEAIAAAAQDAKHMISAQTASLLRSDVMLHPKLVRRLGLSREQLETLQQIYHETKTSLSDAADSIKSEAGTLVDEDDPAVKLGRRAIEVLTERQRQLLAEILAEFQETGQEPTNEPADAPQRAGERAAADAAP